VFAVVIENPLSVALMHCVVVSFHSLFCTIYLPPATLALPN